MSTLVRSLTTDFGGNINERNLHNEIEANATITTALTAVRVDYPDTIYLYFGATPSTAEITELDTVVIPAHISMRSITTSIDNVGVGNNNDYFLSCVSTSYVQVKRYMYNSNKKLKKIVLALWVDVGTIGSVRVVNCMNDMIIAERTDIDATDETAYDMGTLLNLPKMGNQRLRIEMKVDVGSIYMSALANDYT